MLEKALGSWEVLPGKGGRVYSLGPCPRVYANSEICSEGLAPPSISLTSGGDADSGQPYGGTANGHAPPPGGAQVRPRWQSSTHTVTRHCREMRCPHASLGEDSWKPRAWGPCSLPSGPFARPALLCILCRNHL